MIYADTRSGARVSFAQALLESISPSGGLWAPQQVPQIHLNDGDYCSVAAQAAAELVGDWRDIAQLEQLFRTAWQDRGVPAPALRQLDEELWIVELFHGPSLAFKDYGLFFLGRCFDEELTRRKQRGLVLVATSGDTGAAAVAALSSLNCVDLVVLLPKGRISDVQLAQMTRGLADNVHPLLVDGTFDDCQAMAKYCLGKRQFLPPDHLFLSVNSINLGRIVAQLGYHSYVCAQLRQQIGETSLSFAVPSGNFGNAYSAWLARAAGLPVHKILIACNRNDYLHRVFSAGELAPPRRAHQTLSPAMDIGEPSNLERMLYQACGGSSEQVVRWLAGRSEGVQQLGDEAVQMLAESFVSASYSDEHAVQEIQRAHDAYGIWCEPHTALGLRAAREWLQRGGKGPVVAVSTAHPCKFPLAMAEAGFDAQPLPEAMQKRMSAPARGEDMAASPEALEKWLGRAFPPTGG